MAILLTGSSVSLVMVDHRQLQGGANFFIPASALRQAV